MASHYQFNPIQYCKLMWMALQHQPEVFTAQRHKGVHRRRTLLHEMKVPASILLTHTAGGPVVASSSCWETAAKGCVLQSTKLDKGKAAQEVMLATKQETPEIMFVACHSLMQ
jgi:hypothetical protein